MRDKWSETEIPILMDNVNCASNSTNFLSCENNGFGIHNCGHNENVLLSCFESGKSRTSDFQKWTCVIQKSWPNGTFEVKDKEQPLKIINTFKITLIAFKPFQNDSLKLIEIV